MSTRPGQGESWAGVWTTKERGYVLLSSPAPHDKEFLYAGTLPVGPDDADDWKEVGPTGDVLPEASRRPSRPKGAAPGVAAEVHPDGTYLALYLAAPVRQNGVLLGHGLMSDVSLKLVPGGRVEVPHHVTRLRFSPDGRLLASSDTGRRVKLWRVAEKDAGWKEQLTVQATDKAVYDVAFRPDGKMFTFITDENDKPNVLLADTTTGKVLGSFRARNRPMLVAFSPDGKSLATSSPLGRLDVWDVEQVLPAQKK
mgnify:CR=1 FL=1